MVDAADKQEVGIFSNELRKIELEYDFAKDGGAIGVLELGKMCEAMVLHEAYVKVKDAVVSGGAATVEVGVTGDPNAIMTAKLQAALGTGVLQKGESTSEQILLALNDEITLTIAAAVLTAGKIKVVLMVAKY